MFYGLKRHLKKLLLIAIAAILVSCYLPPPVPNDEAVVYVDNPYPGFAPSPIFSRTSEAIMVCRSHQCPTAKKLNSREFLFNSLWYFFDSNVYSTVLLCEADEIHRRCYDNFISFPVKAGVTPGDIFVDSADLADVRMLRNEQQIELIVNYKYYFNGVIPSCRPSRAVLSVNSPDQIILEDALGHECRLTTVGGSLITSVISIDFIDLDYGLIGGHYSFGVAGTASGGKVGYILMRFVKDGLARHGMFKSQNIKYVTSPKECEEEGTATCALCPDTAPYWRNGNCSSCHSTRGTSDHCKNDGYYCGAGYKCLECDSIAITACPSCPENAPYWRNHSCKPCHSVVGISDYCSAEGFTCNSEYSCVECSGSGTATCPSCPEYLPYWRSRACKPCHTINDISPLCLRPNACDKNYNCTEDVKQPTPGTAMPKTSSPKDELPPGKVLYMPLPLE